MPEPAVYLWRENTDPQRWGPTTLTAEGKDEAFLEQLIAEKPDLLGLESHSTGIYGPFVPFRQRPLMTPQGRNIRPDIVFLTASGHAVIVEVKLGDNPELRKRDVIAQVVDYSASFAALKPAELLRLFQASTDDPASWPMLIDELFPEEDNPTELAEVLLHRFCDGEVHLAIACDQEPTGLREMVEGVASQRALSFGFSVVELRPYVTEDKRDGILFFQNTTVKTEIVNRTAVKVTFEQGASKPGVTVTVDSPKKIEDAVAEGRRIRGGRQRAKTVIDEARPLLTAAVEDLIRAGRLSIPGSWQGFSVGNRVLTDSAGKFKLKIRYMDYSEKDLPEEKKGRICICFEIKGEKNRDLRLSEMRKMANSVIGSLEQVLGENVELVEEQQGPNMVVPATAIRGEWTPKSLADWMAKVYRHIADRLPLRAWERATEADLLAVLKTAGESAPQEAGEGEQEQAEADQPNDID